MLRMQLLMIPSWRQWYVGLACLLAAAMIFVDARSSAADDETVRVMTFNLWHGGEAGKQPLEQSAAVIRAARADIVGLQETGGLEHDGVRPDNGKRLAELLNWHHVEQIDRTAVISRFELAAITPRKLGVRFRTPAGKNAWLFNVHLIHKPYQPYQLLKIPYENGAFFDSESAAIEAAREARGAQTERLLEEVQSVADGPTPIFLTGDFNEPSALDWTTAVAAAGKCPVAVDWPTTRNVLDAGFIDAYRQLHPDPLAAAGYTWTPTTSANDPRDHHDRIDFVLVRGNNATVRGAQIVGEAQPQADIVVTPYPSDHRAVVVEATLK